MHTGETICRSYRFGHVEVDVFPELVTITVPYGAEHESFVDASMFIERYTHAAEATLFEDDELGVELHVYPNTENLLSRERPCPLPALDPRLGYWDEPRRRPEVVEPSPARALLKLRLYSLAANTEQYVQEMAARSGVGLMIEALPKTVLALI